MLRTPAGICTGIRGTKLTIRLHVVLSLRMWSYISTPQYSSMARHKRDNIAWRFYMVHSTPQKDMKGERNNVTLSPKGMIGDYLKTRGLFSGVKPEYSVHCPLGSPVCQGYLIRRYHGQKATLHYDQLHLISSAMLSYRSDYVFFFSQRRSNRWRRKRGGCLQFP
jgi:hypothetical protein